MKLDTIKFALETALKSTSQCMPVRLIIIAILTIDLTCAATSVSRHGITWTWQENREVGQYANGDWWVVGPITITDINPLPSEGRNGTVVNPSLGSTQGFDNRFWANPYRDDLNIGTDLPINVAINSSIVSSISNLSSIQWGQIQSYSILTVVDSPPLDGSFRPAYMGSTKRTSKWREADLNYDALARLPRHELSLPDMKKLTNDFEKTWFEKDLTWTGRFLHTPYQAHDGYGKNMAIKTGDAALLLNLDFSNSEKRDLLVNFVQYGIDIAGIRAQGGRWYDTGGHNVGRLAPLLVAAAVFNDEDLKDRCRGSEFGFSEFCQTFFVSQADVDRPRFTGDGRPRLPYTAGDIGLPEWGETHRDNPSRDGNNWDAYYRDICGGQFTAPAMAARVMKLRNTVNYEAFFQYQERHLNYEQGPTYQGEFRYNPTPRFHRQFFNSFKHIEDVSAGGIVKPVNSIYGIGDTIILKKNIEQSITEIDSNEILEAGAEGTVVDGPKEIIVDTEIVFMWKVVFNDTVYEWIDESTFFKKPIQKPELLNAMPNLNEKIHAKSALVVYQLPDLGSIKQNLRQASIVTVTNHFIGDEISWIKINSDNNTIGWLPVNVIDSIGSIMENGQRIGSNLFEGSQIIVTRQNARIREKPDLNAPVIQFSRKGVLGRVIKPLYLHSQDISATFIWAYIKLDNGIEGWCLIGIKQDITLSK